MIVYSDLQPIRDLSGRIQAVLRSSGDPASEQTIQPEEDRDRLSTRLMDIFRVSGNLEAYDLLIDLNKSRLRRLIGHRLRNLAMVVDASDILQEAYFNIYRYPYRFRADRDTAFRVWTGAIVTNIIRRHLKRYFDQAQEMASNVSDSAALELADFNSEPAKLAIEEEDLQNMHRSYGLFLGFCQIALARLPERDQKVLELVEVEGLKYREVGELLETRADNVKMLVFRARQRFFKVLSEILGRKESEEVVVS